MTNEEAKVMLSLIAEALQIVADQALHAHEMAWRTYVALVRQNPGFQAEWGSEKGISYEYIQNLNHEITETLAEIRRRLQD